MKLKSYQNAGTSHKKRSKPDKPMDIPFLEESSRKFMPSKQKKQKVSEGNMTANEKRGLMRDQMMRQLKEYSPFLKSFSDVIQPLLTEETISTLKPLKTRQIFCDGILIPSYPFKKPIQAKLFLQDHSINVINPIVTKKKGYLWTRPVDSSLGVDDLL